MKDGTAKEPASAAQDAAQDVAQDLAQDLAWMRAALGEARRAETLGEVPIGAVLVRAGEIIGSGCNRPISACDPTAHAEIEALRDAARRVGNYRLPGATMYVTVEPCLMCAGALLHARIERLAYGASAPKTGAVATLEHAPSNHRLRVEGGILADCSARLLAEFFAARRACP